MNTFLKEFALSETQLKKLLNGAKLKQPKILSKNISSNTYTFAIVSDTHLCSIHEKIDELHTFYEICKREKITEVFHAGDLLCGWGIYKGQENEVSVFGANAQINSVIERYPKIPSIRTYFITGNHDLSWWNRSGIDVGTVISSSRPDLIYCGQYSADVSISKIKIRLLHPDGGGAYALSYKAQKIAEQIPSGKKPHLLVLGHFHTSHYFFYRNMHIFNAGCFEGQSSFLLRKGINPTIGGWIIKVRIANDPKHTILSITPTFIPFLS